MVCLQFCYETGCVLTGAVAVALLNPAGVPGIVRSAAMVAPPGVSVHAAASLLAQRLYVELLNGATGAAPDVRCAQHGAVIAITVEGEQVATMSEYPVLAEPMHLSLWRRVVRHNGCFFSVLQYRPAALRRQLSRLVSSRLVETLDAYVAALARQQADIGLVGETYAPLPPVPAPLPPLPSLEPMPPYDAYKRALWDAVGGLLHQLMCVGDNVDVAELANELPGAPFTINFDILQETITEVHRIVADPAITPTSALLSLPASHCCQIIALAALTL